tara:strand:- start:344 stop:472 length:129 start_codon:yes stop_codon:yes gene_type:complete
LEVLEFLVKDTMVLEMIMVVIMQQLVLVLEEVLVVFHQLHME